MTVHVVPSHHHRHDELGTARVVLRPSHVAPGLSPELGEALRTYRGGLFLRVRRVRVIVVAKQGARSFVPVHVGLAGHVVANCTCDSRVCARDDGEVLPVDVSAAQEQLLEVLAHDCTGLALELVGLVGLAAVV